MAGIKGKSLSTSASSKPDKDGSLPGSCINNVIINPVMIKIILKAKLSQALTLTRLRNSMVKTKTEIKNMIRRNVRFSPFSALHGEAPNF